MLLMKNCRCPVPSSLVLIADHFLNNLPVMAEQALASGSPGNNPRVPSADEIIEIYRKLW